MRFKSIVAVAAGVISSLMLSVTAFAATNELTGLEVSDAIAAQPYAAHISGGFTRVKNGKPTEFTEYVFGQEVLRRFSKSNLSTSYTTALERGTHFLFSPVENDLALGVPASTVDLSNVFTHNASKLSYNPATMTYDYYEYGSLHQDAEDGQTLTFKNVLLQNVSFTQFDKNGYLTYNVIGSGVGYYLTDGKAVPITWSKASETGFTHFYGPDGAEISVNKGKTYIGLVPSDSWDKVQLN